MSGEVGCGCLGATAVAAMIGATLLAGYFPVEDRTCTVVEKDRAASGESSSMRVYTDECGVLEVRDAWLVGEFRSADRYAALQPGVTYRMTTRGVRFGLLSAFPNVVDAAPAGGVR